MPSDRATMRMLVLAGSAALGALAGPAARAQGIQRLPAEEWTVEAARHLLFRAGFGGTPDEVEALHRRGLEGAVGWLVDYEALPDLVGPLHVAPTRPGTPLARLPEEERRAAAQRLRAEEREKMAALTGWWYRRMLRSLRPLEEKMTLFWHGHFTSAYADVRSAHHMGLQNALLREHATGNFRELVHAVAKDPAMLRYLDGFRNNRRRPNENFARELMELFTMGEGHYTEADVKEAARAFTGWTFRGGAFVFNRGAHDPGPKTFLGRTGNLTGEDVIEAILDQEATARHVAGRVLAFFLGEELPQEELEPFAARFRAAGYETKPLLRALFTSRLFYASRFRGNLVKSPVMLAVSSARLLGWTDAPPLLLVRAAAEMGQAVFAPPNVAGWDEGPAWITTSLLLLRQNFAGTVVERAPLPALPGMGSWTAEEAVDRLAERLLAVPLPDARRQVLVDFLEEATGGRPVQQLPAAGRQRLGRDLLHLIMCLPEFQAC